MEPLVYARKGMGSGIEATRYEQHQERMDSCSHQRWLLVTGHGQELHGRLEEAKSNLPSRHSILNIVHK
jgi:hypothetical protein